MSDDPRCALADALAALDVAAAGHQRATVEVERATELRRIALSAVAAFHDLDREVTAHAVGRIRAGDTDVSPPPRIADAMTRRDAAADHLRTVAAALDGLKHAAGQRHADLLAARQRVDEAAAKIMSAEADVLADRLAAAEETARELRGRLMSVALVWTPVGATPKPLPLGSQARTLLTNAPANSRAVADECWTQAWKSWHAELLTNPQAGAPTEPAPPKPADTTPSVPWPVQQERLFEAQRARIAAIREAHPEVNCGYVASYWIPPRGNMIHDWLSRVKARATIPGTLVWALWWRWALLGARGRSRRAAVRPGASWRGR